jgi:16S rRNA (uracil1498-N3)-methyltransferase
MEVGTSLVLSEAITRHIHVLRLPVGAHITLFNGNGGEYVATLDFIDRKTASVQIKVFNPRDVELPYAVTVAQALPENSKMDWIVEKAVELGAAGLQPLAAKRCVTRLTSERAEKKTSHWNGIVVAASEQCGRNRLMQVAKLADFAQWTEREDLHRRLLLSPRAEQSLSEWAKHQPPQALALVIGPEGGLSPEEEDMAMSRGMIAVGMGERILRTETAGLAALAALNAIWGTM